MIVKIKHWTERVPEIANLLNPAFCASIIYSVIFEYQKTKGHPMPFVLSYLILPIILHKKTRERIDSKTNMTMWIQKYPDVLIEFPQRTRSLVFFTNESVEYLLQEKIICLNNLGLNIIKTLSKSYMGRSTDKEILECHNKSEHLGRWFARMNTEENIYAAWGVKP
jgi:hypothetical protein